MDSIFKKRGCLSHQEITKYLREELSEDERFSVENHMLDCELCSAAVEGLATAANEETTEADIRLIRQATSHRPTPVKSTARLKWINRIAAVALLLIMVFAAIRYWNALHYERLAAQYFERAENDYITLRSPGDNQQLPAFAELEKALEYYEAQEYENSLPHFDNYLMANPGDEQAAVMAASAALQAGVPGKVEPYLKGVIGKGNALADWHLALALIQQRKISRARRQLERIADDSESPYRLRAAELLEKL